MLDRLQRHLGLDVRRPDGDASARTLTGPDSLLRAFGGASFGGGAYRIHAPRDVARLTAMAREAFPDLGPGTTCIGSTWCGDQIAVTDTSDGPTVQVLDIAWGEATDTGLNLEGFHEHLLVTSTDVVLHVSLYRAWRRAGGAVPGPDQCVAFAVPLFLGGAEELANLDLTSLDVTWGVNGQLLAQVRDLPPGTAIGEITVVGPDDPL
ncbi:hypothetical protein Cch01nite_43550 [Cellulomonas chitinilytica]|uniref:Uncharacterized protein n=1 Tax=Cellulomonas chitinilytica TaxID=398759 RepID=A0A919U3U2_9CELL|nr:hypothetical protein [Cellulomonas chitinilytica]GIG23631.1 hypothetical protein Cch01nite_43550 [Cellulomonas chitinilytica]